MTPETIQYLVYAALVVGGWFLRHYNVLGLAGDKTPIVPPPVVNAPVSTPTPVPSTPVVVPVAPVNTSAPVAQVEKVVTDVEKALSDFIVKHLQNSTPKQ